MNQPLIVAINCESCISQVLNLLAFISASVASSKYTANAQVTIFLFVSMISFWISLFILCFYLFRFDEKLDSISFSTFVSCLRWPKLTTDYH